MLASLLPIVAAASLIADQASEQAGPVDALFWFITGVSAIMTVVIFASICFFAYKYRRRTAVHATQIEGSNKLELTWSILPFLVMLVMFGWGADLFYKAQNPPTNAMEVFVTGKQWMWKVQYPDGSREIDALHVPVGTPVKLTMASEDVIHSFSVPAFRIRHDVIPGHYDSVWFTPNKPGKYHLFCTEYCGNQHAGMTGWVYVMEPREYANWASGGGGQGTLAEQGQALFQQFGCATCHLLDQQGRCPILRGIYNKPVQLDDGRTVIADDAYLRESILDPNAKIVAGFQPDVMPHFKGQVTEENVIQLIAYIKSLSPSTPASQQGGGQPTPPTPSRAARAASQANAAKPGQAVPR
ncbi:MAG: cytochrome c oxidase subunit II [Acidobacteriaceae bacterium]|nr:cytochrome c oxidase subunit II [Acidobacteriota bacterium]MBV8807152.1 cytochrome c oxidase subunit II [Acidobacteriaceae bacterium]MBV9501063.1 cytochrome c oxidase subunit II [Acidobacteriaceae bacterium]